MNVLVRATSSFVSSYCAIRLSGISSAAMLRCNDWLGKRGMTVIRLIWRSSFATCCSVAVEEVLGVLLDRDDALEHGRVGYHHDLCLVE